MSDAWKLVGAQVHAPVAADVPVLPNPLARENEILRERIRFIGSVVIAAPHAVTCKAFLSNREPSATASCCSISVAAEPADDRYCDCWKRQVFPGGIPK